MLLAIDIGNTNLVGGLFDGPRLVETFRFETVRTKTADEYAVLLSELLKLRGIDHGRVNACIVASVVPPDH
jgi:type III pantothenate kinase